MEAKKSDSPSLTLQDFYSAVKSALFQLIQFINFVFLKLIRTSVGFEDEGPLKDDRNLFKRRDSNLQTVRKWKGISEIPGPRAFPFVGTLLTSPALSSKDLMKSNEDRMRKYGSIVKEELYWNFPMLIILDSDDIETAMKGIGNFRPGVEIISVYRNLNPDRYDSTGLVNMNGKDWERLHKATVPLITSPKYIQSMTTGADGMALDFVSRLDEAGPLVSNFEDLLKRYVAETSMYTVLGTRSGFLDAGSEGPTELFGVQEDYWDAFHQSAYGYPWWKYIPTNLWKRFSKAEDNLVSLVKKSIQQSIDEDNVSGVLSGLLKTNGISENDKILVALEFMTGGTEPVFISAVILLYFLSKDKNVAQKIFDELQAVLPNKDSPIEEGTLARLPYLKACIMETQRVCPATPMLARISEHPIELGKYKIPAYTLIVVQSFYGAMQEKSFYRAKEFLPERWIYKDGVPPYQPHRRNIMLNFGTGPRTCPGRRASTLHLTVLMARLFRKYEIKFEKELELEFDWLIRPKLPVNIGFHERIDD